MLSRTLQMLPLLALGSSLAGAQQLPDAHVPRLPRMPLPRPAANAPLAAINDNRIPAGRLEKGVLTIAMEVVEAAYQAEGPNDPVVRVLALQERGKAPSVPSPLLRAPAGTEVRLSLRNRSDSTLTFRGLRQSPRAADDTIPLAPGATREVTFRLDSVGTFLYWATLPGFVRAGDRNWLDAMLSGAIVVDPAGTPPGPAKDRVWVITEWFKDYPDRPFESVLTFNGKGWPYSERITLAQNDSVRWRFVNASGVEHPLHLHGFYFRVERRGGERADTAIAPERQALQNVHLMQQGGTSTLAFVPTTPGNWVFHCHFADHVSEEVSLRGSPEPHTLPEQGVTLAGAPHGDHVAVPATHGADPKQGHSMHGLVLGIKVTPAPGVSAPEPTQRRTLRLLAQKRDGMLPGLATAYGFVLQQGDSAPPRDRIQIPGPVLELKRGEPVRIVVKNNLGEPTAVHWHGLEIESYPDGVPGVSGMGAKVMPPIAPGDSFAAEFTPPRAGTYPYHAHAHELAQIGSGMYGAIVVSDTPRDTTRDHVVVAGGAGVQLFSKSASPYIAVNGGRAQPRPIRLAAGDTNRLRFVSIHAQTVLRFRLSDDSTVARWTALAKDGADLPPALRTTGLATTELAPGETADFLYVAPSKPGAMKLEVFTWPSGGPRVEVPVMVVPRK